MLLMVMNHDDDDDVGYGSFDIHVLASDSHSAKWTASLPIRSSSSPNL